MPTRSRSPCWLRDDPVQAVEVVVELRRAHVAVDRGAPVAAVAFAAAVVEVEHDVALLHQQVVEHLLAEVIRIARADVLQVAGAVHEHHDRIRVCPPPAAPGRSTCPRWCRRRASTATCTNCGWIQSIALERGVRVSVSSRAVAAGGVDHRQLRRQVAARNGAPAAALPSGDSAKSSTPSSAVSSRIAPPLATSTAHTS